MWYEGRCLEPRRLEPRPVVRIEATMRALTVAAMIIAVLTASAYAQENKTPRTQRSDSEKKDDADIDKAYKAATDRRHTPAAKIDPWQAVRPATPDKPKH